jgi:hypothetical protein
VYEFSAGGVIGAMERRLVVALAVAIAVGAGALVASAIPRDDEEVIFYPTYGVKQAAEWRIVIRDLTNARQRCPARLKGMTIVESPTIADCVPSVER